MYSHPNMTEEQRRIYMRGWLRQRKRFRRYHNVLMPRYIAGSLAAGAVFGYLLRALVS